MPSAICDGLVTHYEVMGSGPPLLMFSPAGFDATAEKWTTQGIYAKIKILEQLARRYRCIIYDRRESGASGGRVERLGWNDYVAQAKGLLEHLGIERAHLLGGCMGCSPVIAFGSAHPEMVASMVLFWPAGGPRYRIATQGRFAEHESFVRQQGLAAVVELVRAEGKSFGTDPRGGPWAPVIKGDASFAAAYANQNVEPYAALVGEISRTMFDRDTVAGAEPEDLMRLEIPALIIPGNDPSHAISGAAYLDECLPRADYWDVPVSAQTENAAPARILDFLVRVAI